MTKAVPLLPRAKGHAPIKPSFLGMIFLTQTEPPRFRFYLGRNGSELSPPKKLFHRQPVCQRKRAIYFLSKN